MINIPRELLEKLAPPEAMNQDEMGGCVWCGGGPPRRGMYAGADLKHHHGDCPWVLARRLLGDEWAQLCDCGQPKGHKPGSYQPRKKKDGDYVDFGDVARDLCGQQSQYASRYINPRFKDEYPQLGEGLRFQGDLDDYSLIKIHREDVCEFVRRYKARRRL